jgi:hypothetical protein
LLTKDVRVIILVAPSALGTATIGEELPIKFGFICAAAMRTGLAALFAAILVLLANSGVAVAKEVAATCGAGHLCLYQDIDYEPHPGSHWLSNGNFASCTPLDVADGKWSSVINNSRYTVELWNLKGRNSKRLVATVRPGERVRYFGSAGNDTVDRAWNLSCA